MKDGITKEQGNSRYLRSAIPDDITFSQFIEMLRDGTFPIDFNGINEDGWEQLPTWNNKANMLPDNVAQQINPESPPENVGEALGIVACPYDVGDILQTVNPKDPHERWVGTSWVVWAPGRTPVGVGIGVFAGVETEVGELTHTHPMLNHVHSMAHTHTLNSHNHSLASHTHPINPHVHPVTGMAQMATWLSSAGNFELQVRFIPDLWSWTPNRTIRVADAAVTEPAAMTQTSGLWVVGDATANPEQNTRVSGTTNTGTNNDNTGAVSAPNTGNPTALNNLAERSNIQPSITCFYWKRVA